MHGGVDAMGDTDVLARLRKHQTSHRPHQAFPPADHWSCGPVVLYTSLGPVGGHRCRGAASVCDAQAAHSFVMHYRETMR